MKRILIAGVLTCVIAGCGQKAETPDTGGQTPPTTETTTNTATSNTAGGDTTAPTNTASTYPDSTDGLKKLISDILAASKAGDKEKVSTLVKSLMLTNHEAWFKQTFGDDKGAKLSADYGKFLGDFEPSASELFAKMVEKGQTNIQVDRFAKAGDPKAVGLQEDALKAMKSAVPLYSVRLLEPGKDTGMHLYSFVYVDGAFRFISKLKM